MELELTTTLEGGWHGVHAGGCMNFPESSQRNEQYYLRIFELTQCRITLTQTKVPGQPLWSIGVIVANKLGGRIDRLLVGDEVASSGPYINRESVSCEAVLAPLDHSYTLLATTFHAHEEGTYFLRVDSDKPVSLTKAPSFGMRRGVSNLLTGWAHTNHKQSYLMETLHAPPHAPSVAYTALRDRLKASQTHWQDETFPAQSSWGRLRDMRVKPLPSGDMPACCVFDHVDPEDIVQGELGDCWFLSAVSALAMRDSGVLDLFVEPHTNPEGVYGVLFCTIDGWQEVLVDDYVPMVDGRPRYASSVQSHEMYPSLIEKAFAKLCHGYSNIERGQAHDAFFALTGGVAEMVSLDAHAPLAEVDAVWERLCAYQKHDFLLACGSPPGSDHSKSPVGIVLGHAYAILHVRDYNGFRLVHVRNPHGVEEWKGAWSAEDKEKWTPETIKALGQPKRHDGVFWMEFGDFLRSYRNVYMCKVFHGLKWQLARVKGAWTQGTMVQYLLRVSCPVHIVLAVRQRSRREGERDAVFFSLFVIRHGGRPVKQLTTDLDYVHRGAAYSNQLETSFQADLPASPEGYTVALPLHEGKGANDFILRVFTKGGAAEVLDFAGNLVSEVVGPPTPPATKPPRHVTLLHMTPDTVQHPPTHPLAHRTTMAQSPPDSLSSGKLTDPRLAMPTHPVDSTSSGSLSMSSQALMSLPIALPAYVKREPVSVMSGREGNPAIFVESATPIGSPHPSHNPRQPRSARSSRSHSSDSPSASTPAAAKVTSPRGARHDDEEELGCCGCLFARPRVGPYAANGRGEHAWD